MSNSKRILFNTSGSDNGVDENNDYQFNDSLMSSLSAALKDLDDECDALGILPADDLKKPLYEIHQQTNQLTSDNSIDDINKIQGIKNITETPKSCHVNKPNLESTRKSLNFLYQDSVIKTCSIDALSPILPKSPGKNITPSGNYDATNHSDTAAALDTLESVNDDNISASSELSAGKKTFLRKIANRFSGRSNDFKSGENSKIGDNNSAIIRTAKLYRSFSQRIKKVNYYILYMEK